MGICGVLGFISSYFVGLMPETKEVVMNSCIEKLIEFKMNYNELVGIAWNSHNSFEI